MPDSTYLMAVGTDSSFHPPRVLFEPVVMIMELTPEIRDGHTTPSQLLRSRGFVRYLKVYKEVFICSPEKSVTKKPWTIYGQACTCPVRGFYVPFKTIGLIYLPTIFWRVLC